MHPRPGASEVDSRSQGPWPGCGRLSIGRRSTLEFRLRRYDMQNQVTEIQAGWTVHDRDGRELGKVIRLDTRSMWVKGKGLLAREMEILTLPRQRGGERVRGVEHRPVGDLGWARRRRSSRLANGDHGSKYKWSTRSLLWRTTTRARQQPSGPLRGRAMPAGSPSGCRPTVARSGSGRRPGPTRR